MDRCDWRPSGEELPSDENDVLITDGHGVWKGYLSFRDGKPQYWYSEEVCPGVISIESEEITHWMPLPEPPKDHSSQD